jgi:hypothetical protein
MYERRTLRYGFAPHIIGVMGTGKRSKRRRVAWAPVLDHAVGIVGGYDTGVTLRQLFYRLASDGSLPNLQTYYRRLSEHTAKRRREGAFPDLLDRTSRIEEPLWFGTPAEARAWLRDLYRRDRTDGQEWTVVLGVEKAGISAQLDAWFTDPFGIPHVALGGYASQTLCDQVARYIVERGRPAALLYAGDHDPTGEDIDRDFEARVGVFDKVVRIALNADQVAEYGLVENPDPEVGEKLERDPRAKRFLERHGSLVQFEVDAIDPDTLRNLYRTALDGLWDDNAYQAVIDHEDEERGEL